MRKKLFTLLRLPILARMEVVKSMPITDIFSLARTSKKLERHIKTNYKLPNTLLVSCFNDLKYVNCRFTGEKNIEMDINLDAAGVNNHSRKLGNRSAPTQKATNAKNFRFTNYCEIDDIVEGYMNLIDFFNNFFDVRSVSVKIETPLSYYLTVDHIETRGLKIKTIKWITDDYDANTFNAVLTAAVNAENLDIVFPQFVSQVQFNRFNEYSLNTLNVFNASWVSVQNLCSLIQCKNIELENAIFSNHDANVFLKHFVSTAGQLLSLTVGGQCVSASNEPPQFNMEKALNGIANEKISENKCIIKNCDGVEFEFVCGYGFSLNARPKQE